MSHCHCGCHDGCHSHEHEHHHDHGSLKADIIKIIISAALFIASFFLPDGMIKTVVLITSYLIVGYETIYEALNGLISEKSIDECFLMTIASVGAIAVGEVSEASAVMILYSIGQILESVASERSKKSITALLELHPDHVNVRQNGVLVKVLPETVKVGDTVIVLAGERIALDGKVIKGSSAVDNSALTGESLPISVSVGDAVFGGGINCSGTIEVLVEKEYHDSSASRILEMVKDAQSKKTKAERFISRFARKYTLIVIAIAAIVAFVFPIFTGYAETFSTWLYRGLTLLVISCPCALVISVPLTFFAGVGCASSKGILIKGTNCIEQLSKLESVALDKTGTLTYGTLSVSSLSIDDQALRLAAYAESRSTHPIAKALVKHFVDPINDDEIASTEEIAGKGIISLVGDKEVAVGNEELMHQIGITSDLDKVLGVGVHVAVNKEYKGCVMFTDKVKPDSEAAICDLKSLGVSGISMLTGDSEAAAKEVASSVGITDVSHSLKPEDKVSCLERIISETNGSTAFVGDGINDAPVLALADLGIAMGALGSDAAIESADVVLLDDKLSKLAQAVKISRKTLRIVWQNILFSLGAKLLVMMLTIFGISGMWLAVFADTGVMLIAVINALRALKSPKK